MSAALRARLAGGAVLAAFAAFIAIGVVWSVRHIEELRPVREGALAPGFTLPRLDREGKPGALLSLEELRGKVVLVDFWATWCGPCRAAMPVLQKVSRRFAGDDLVVLSVNVEGPEMAREAAEMVGELAPDLVLLSDDDRVRSEYKIKVFPHMVLIDRQGVVRWVESGFRGAGKLETALVAHLESLL
jgi:thiol-disulfide isomerase/thioredoxin